MKKLFYILFIVLMCSGTSYAACDGSSPSLTAASSSAADINDCIDDAINGDTITVPSGATTWDAQINTDSKEITLVGPGTSNKFTLGVDNAITLTGAVRVTGFYFYTDHDPPWTAVQAAGDGWRVDHCKFETTIEGNNMGVVVTNGISATGLLDNSEIINGRVIVYGGSNFADMSTQWSDDLQLGSADAVYVEDCTFDNGRIENSSAAIDSNRGGKYVFRYNTTDYTYVRTHQLQSPPVRASRHWEIYGNNLQHGQDNIILLAGGTGVVFFNDMTFADSGDYINIDYARTWDGLTTNNDDSDGRCDGDNVIDGNDDATGWLCRDQVGAGIDASQWAVVGDAAPTQTKTPAYIWNNRDDGVSKAVTLEPKSGMTDHFKADRDYFDYEAGFDGSSGIGCGTLGNRPSATGLSDGIGYWATDQSCSDLTGLVGASHTANISGTLYVVSSETWVEYFTPYTYPHPLRGYSPSQLGITDSGISHGNGG